MVTLAIALPLSRASAQSPLPDALRGIRGTEPASRTIDPPTAPGQASPAVPVAAIPPLPALQATPTPEPTSSRDLPKPFAAFSATARSLRDSVVSLARAQIGRRYRFGGTTPHGFDCSGLVRYVMGALHIPLPRTARDQARAGALVPRDTSQLRPGDLVAFGSSTHRISHIGIYVGGGHFVQASSKAGRVIETPLNRRLVRGVKPWRGARRLIPGDDSTAVSESPGSLSGRSDAD